MLVIPPAYGQCPKPVSVLNKGDEAPCKGFLFSPEKESEIRETNMKYRLLMEETKLHIQRSELWKNQAELSDKIAEKEAQKAELWRGKAYEMTEKYMEAEDNRGKRDLFFLIGGVILTVAAGYAVGQASK